MGVRTVGRSAWEELVGGQLRIEGERSTHDRLHLVTREEPSPHGGAILNPVQASTLLGVLCGGRQKVVAMDLVAAVSTVSFRVKRALRRLNLSERIVPLPLVVVAQSFAGLIDPRGARREQFVEEGAGYVVLSVARPDMRRAPGLSAAERDVARLLIEGLSYAEIARQRGSSIHTVATQRWRVFSVLRVSGRYDLIRRAAELGCFDDSRSFAHQ
jgi:DNA-binding NarL/FixJ family response regulator